jgi:DNA-binding NtrC family response regulator
MPEVDGRALYAHIRTLYPNVRFIFMTGTESDSGMFDVFGGAPASCLNKPFEMTSLLLEVRHALDDA